MGRSRQGQEVLCKPRKYCILISSIQTSRFFSPPISVICSVHTSDYQSHQESALESIVLDAFFVPYTRYKTFTFSLYLALHSLPSHLVINTNRDNVRWHIFLSTASTNSAIRLREAAHTLPHHPHRTVAIELDRRRHNAVFHLASDTRPLGYTVDVYCRMSNPIQSQSIQLHAIQLNSIQFNLFHINIAPSNPIKSIPSKTNSIQFSSLHSSPSPSISRPTKTQE